ncbi:hypothetical protein [Deinococcus petrolearius]|uniref:Gp5/Type VI secretion system Vgr protein OB-fold domain-containing protein n=1 Tax=Deinococcus petrolearius TaxID=1751295 RepID=A0ABW1DD94_9DEIO
MPLISVSGLPAGPPSTITHPLTGRPWADVTLALPSAPWAAGQQVEVELEGGATYRMTVERIGPRGGFVSARLIGGTGGLGQTITAKYYRDIPAATVLREVLEECGEAAGTLDLPGTLSAWTRPEGPAHEAIRALMMRYPAYAWRMDPGGQVHAGVPKWPPHADPLRIEREDAAVGTYVCELRPSLLPDQHVTLTRGEEEIGKRVTRVTHAIDTLPGYGSPAPLLRTVVGTGDGEDLGVSGLEQAVRRTMRHTDYHALRPATIIRDHGNHEVDLEVLEAGWPQLVRVPLLVPLPGVQVKVKAGSPALLLFEQGDPAQPRAECRASATLEYIQLRTGKGQKVTLDDDRGGVSPEDKVYLKPFLKLEDQAGQKVELWAEEKKERVTVRDKAGQTVELLAQVGQERVTVRDKAGSTLVMDAVARAVTLTSAGNMTLTAAGVLTLDGTHISLGGEQPVARVGDAVSTPAGPGTIAGGSSKVGSG